VKPGQCATPEPGESWEDKIERMQADGTITIGDADEIRNFASFLRAAPGPMKRGERFSPEDAAQMRAALWEHYPDQYPELNPERTPDAPTDV